MSENGIVFELRKNALETLRFQVAQYKGKEYGDVRIYFRDVDDELQPSRKGLTISPSIWHEFVEGIEQLGGELRERGLLEEADEATI